MTPRPAYTHLWDGTRTLPDWLTGHHHWDDGQLVVHGRDDTTPIRAGWTIVQWTDGVVTVASPQVAERVYGPDGPWVRAAQAEEELAATRTNLASSVTHSDEALRIAEEAEARLASVTALYGQWVKAGPPLGVSLARWWDARLIELNTALHDPKDQT